MFIHAVDKLIDVLIGELIFVYINSHLLRNAVL